MMPHNAWKRASMRACLFLKLPIVYAALYHGASGALHAHCDATVFTLLFHCVVKESPLRNE